MFLDTLYCKGCGSGIGESGKIFVEAEALWKKKLEAEANSEAFGFFEEPEAEAVKFLWKRKQTRKRLTLYRAGSLSKNFLLLPHPCFLLSL